MKLIIQTQRNTFANRFKHYSLLVCLILLAIFLFTNTIDNSSQDVVDTRG